MTDLTERQIRQLVNNLNPQRVASRSQGNATLSYLEAWDVRATMIRIFGFAEWSAETVDSTVLRIDEVPSSRDPKKNNWRVLAQSTVKVTIHQTGAVYSDSAAASQIGPDIGEVTDFALKTSESDAFKRACINLGTQFGLSLYNNGSVADVIKVLLAPGQNETLDAVKNPKPKEIEALPADVDETPAPGEDPRDDMPMALEFEASVGEYDQDSGEFIPDPEGAKRSRDRVRQAFDRRQS